MFRSIVFTLVLLLGYEGVPMAGQSSSVAPAPVKNGSHSKRPVTVADVIEMANIGDSSAVGGLTNGNVVAFSPDGGQFAFVTKKGRLKSNTVEFSLLVYRTAEVFSSPRPEVVARLESSSNRPAISRLTWLQDNETIAFLGEHPGESPQIYRVNCGTKQIVRLTNQATGVVTYSISDKGDSFVYLSEPSSNQGSNEVLHRGYPVTSQNWDDLYFGDRRQVNGTRREVFIKTAKLKTPQRVGVVAVPGELSGTQDLSISPNGRYALITAFNTNPPATWAEYKPSFYTLSLTARCPLKDAYTCPEQYMLLDLEKRTIEPLMSAPVVRAREGMALFAWTRGNSILVVNTFLPLVSARIEERDERRSNIYAAEVILPERKIVEIKQRKTPFHAFDLHSEKSTDEFITEPFVEAFGPPLEFRREASGWKVSEASPAAQSSRERISLTLDQDMNSPPELVAKELRTGMKAVLLDLNPEFKNLSFGRVESFKWVTPDGSPFEGSLYFPPDYVAGRRYPLIIQTHGYHRDLFWPDGPYTSAFAAQPLANRGFLVLQMPTANPYASASANKKTVGVFATPEEGPYFTGVFESAIDKLDRLGLADPTRVGLSGFSRTVYHVLYALTHSTHHFAAAVAADGINFGYVNCLFSRTDRGLCERMNGGGPPFGQTLAGWEREAPDFRLDKVEAPLLLQAISDPIGEWEILAGLRWLKKPVEMLNFYPYGEHQLVLPQQRLLSQGSVVDWYCFWLKGEEDPDPAKAEEYARWRKMKRERDHKPALAGIHP